MYSSAQFFSNQNDTPTFHIETIMGQMYSSPVFISYSDGEISVSRCYATGIKYIFCYESLVDS